MKKKKRVFCAKIPKDLRENEKLQKDIQALLPQGYDFEIEKTIWRIRQLTAQKVCLQFPEGLLAHSCNISRILETHCDVRVITLIDAAYGACCVEDLSASNVGCDLLVHYGHSCLFPVTDCCLDMLYIFVSIAFDVDSFLVGCKEVLNSGERICLVATIQFVRQLPYVKKRLEIEGFPEVTIPQKTPLSRGELLGCTSPSLCECSSKENEVEDRYDSLVFIGDGRFHLEAAMIRNPSFHGTFLKWDPYSKKMSKETYEVDTMQTERGKEIRRAQQTLLSDDHSHKRQVGVIIGGFGRQGGGPRLLSRVESLLQSHSLDYFVVCLSQITPQALLSFSESVGCWIQLACPRLSIDWGHSFASFGCAPLLNLFEAFLAFSSSVQESSLPEYPMDHYSLDGGPWSVRFAEI